MVCRLARTFIVAIAATIQSSVGHPGEGLPVYTHGRRRPGSGLDLNSLLHLLAV